MSTPRIAVVAPTKSRETRLAFLLEGLAAQSLERDAFEVIVVRDGAPSGSTTPPQEDLNLRFLIQPASGPAAARNRGWRATPAPLVAFIDDDCRPAPDWLARLLAASDGPDTIIQGRTEPDPDERHLLFGLARSQEISGGGWYQSCNIAYPRELLARLGGFDERFPGPAGEDTDLGLRAAAAGAALAYADDALVWHAVHARPLPRALRETLRWDVVSLVIARHPRQRRLIHRGYFWKRSHAAVSYSLLLAALAFARRGSILAGLAALPYLNVYLDRDALTPRGLVSQALHLPSRFLVDLAEVLATLRGAARERTLVI